MKYEVLERQRYKQTDRHVARIQALFLQRSVCMCVHACVSPCVSVSVHFHREQRRWRWTISSIWVHSNLQHTGGSTWGDRKRKQKGDSWETDEEGIRKIVNKTGHPWPNPNGKLVGTVREQDLVDSPDQRLLRRLRETHLLRLGRRLVCLPFALSLFCKQYIACLSA